MPRPLTTLHEAIATSAPLASLAQRLRESNARFDAIRGSLPGTLATQVRPGPIDDLGWTLLAANGAAASKLRQLVPRLEAALAQAGFAATLLRVRVQAP